MRDKDLRKITITEEDIARHPQLAQPLREIPFSEKLKTIFPDMFGYNWAEYMTFKDMVRALVIENTVTMQNQLRVKDLTWYLTCRQSDRDRFYEVFEEVAPEIRQTMQVLKFLP